MKEKWVPIEGYEGLYEVSDFGRIKNCSTGLIKTEGKDKRGYPMIELYKNNVRKHYYVHKLVKRSFTPKEQWGETINHLNENKNDNRLCNLEFCTFLENIKYGTRGIRSGLSRTNHPMRSMPIIGVDDKGGVFEFVSIAEAARITKICRPNIIKCLKKERRQAGGYMWNYKK